MYIHGTLTHIMYIYMYVYRTFIKIFDSFWVWPKANAAVLLKLKFVQLNCTLMQ